MMDLKLYFFLLVLLAKNISARPEPDYDSVDKCEIFFSGAGLLGLTQEEKDAHLTYECVERNRCNDNRDVGGITPFGSSELLTTLINSAQIATCPEAGYFCCNNLFVKIAEPEQKCDTSQGSGYSCVSNDNCLVDDIGGNQSEGFGSCYDLNAPTRNVEKTCCKTENVINKPQSCAVLADYNYRCVAKSDCRGAAAVAKRTIEICLDPSSVADNAICENESEMCCHEENIQRPCEDYSPDGYQCSEKCFDMPQDEPVEGERKSNIEFYAPKQAKCPQREICCKRTEKITPVKKLGGTKCSDWGPEFECTTLERCKADTFAIKEENANENLLGETISLLFQAEGDDKDLFAQNSDFGVAVNPDVVPCEFPQLVCCEPSKEAIVEEADTRSVLLPLKKCGIHNPNGIQQSGVATLMTGVSSQEGEWPHACLIFSNGNIIGGASLIASKVFITAAHLLKSDEKGTVSVDGLMVRCGEYDLTSSEVERYEHQERDVKSFTIHPYYSGSKTLRNDLAIIYTAEEFSVAPNVNPICLPKMNVSFSEFTCFSMGWGVNSKLENSFGQNIMKQVELKRITDRELCQAKIKATGNVKNDWNLDPSWTCANLAGDANVNENVLCDGDGGGSLVCQEQGTGRNVLAGVIAFGIGCGNSSVPEIFASTKDALCFIDFDVKCKHGNEFISDFDYATECSDWFDKQITGLTPNKNIPFVKRYLDNLGEIKDACVSKKEPKQPDTNVEIPICAP